MKIAVPLLCATLRQVFAIALLFVATQVFAENKVNSPANEPALRYIQSNGIRMRIAEMGQGPLVILVHGWPESWYSWRHQLPALAAAGFHAVAPDMRGYGKSDKPQDVESYDIHHVTADIVGIVDALGEKSAMLVGHDWGAIVGWHCMLLHPERFTAYIAMSVPYAGHGQQSLIQTLQKAYNDNFYYILYFQEPGVAEKEFDSDPRGILSRLYLSPDSPREAPVVTDPKRAAGGWIPRLGAPKGLPPWLTQTELDYYVNEFKEAGLRGGINYYRNFHHNWESTPQLADAKVSAPVYFIAGEKDVVIRGATAEGLTASMRNAVSDLRGVKLFPNAGHWIQQERADEVNATLIEFLQSVKPAR
ncbi:MAG TPA: alpha/beta hydrolase [Steroidobacteraceae bacterium]|nr:alpha/beta hydrolase [Steroidobacteraceae bacterium]